MARYVNRSGGVQSVAFDDGNHTKKILCDTKYVHEESAVALVHGNYERYMNGNATKAGYIMVDGAMYAVGSTARRERRSLPKGAERYTRDYYRIGLAYMLAKLYGKASVDVDLYATHAPQDYAFAPNMVEAVSGVMNCITPHGKTQYSVHRLTASDEPLGLANHTFYGRDGYIDRYWTVGTHIILVCDVGGFTTDLAIIENGVVDYGTMRSIEAGADNIYRMFIQGVRDDSQLRSQLGKLSESNYVPELVKDAIVTKNWANDSRNPISVEHVANDVLNFLISEVEDGINSMGGLVNYTDVIFGGGGAGLIYNEFVGRYRTSNVNFHIAESNSALLRYANVFGVKIDNIKADRWGQYGVKETSLSEA